MATSKKAKKTAATAIAVIGLAEIVAAGANGMYTSPEVHGPLVEQGLVEINPAMTNENGEIATRATVAGIQAVEASQNVTSEENATNVVDNAEQNGDNSTSETGVIATTTKKVQTMFKIENDIPMPSGSARGRGGNLYPFDDLEVGQSFFVANSEDKPNAAKSLASTVSSATARYAVPSEDGATKTNKKGEVVPVMVETRKFVVRAVTEEGVAGARVWRTA